MEETTLETDITGRVILKWKVWTLFIWLRIGSSGRL